MQPFIILGLPRSRTAWLASYFSFGDVHCYHDLMVEHSPAGVLSTIGAKDGSAESALCLYPNVVLNWESEGKVRLLIIDRNIREVSDSYRQAMMEDGIELDVDSVLHSACIGFEMIKRFSSSLIIPYSQIDNRIYEIHSYLTPQIKFSPRRFNLLKDFKVTQKIKSRLDFASMEKENQLKFLKQ